MYSTDLNPVEFQSKLVDWNSGLCGFEPLFFWTFSTTEISVYVDSSGRFFNFFGLLVRLEFRLMWIQVAVFNFFGTLVRLKFRFMWIQAALGVGLLVQGYQLKLQIFIAS